MRPHLDIKAFPAEFARFVDFVGEGEIDNLILRTVEKLKLLPTTWRRVAYGDRYDLHLQILDWVDAPDPFQLDPEKPRALRCATLIAGINHIAGRLPQKLSQQLRGRVVDGMKPDRDIRQLEHEIICLQHLLAAGAKVGFPEFDGSGRHDYAVAWQGQAVDVECKTVTPSTGSDLKEELVAGLARAFKMGLKAAAPPESGLLTMSLKRKSSDCSDLPGRLERALKKGTLEEAQEDFELVWHPRPAWAALRHVDDEQIQQALRDDPLAEAHDCFLTSRGQHLVGFAVAPHAPRDLASRLVDIIRAAADQCSGSRPALVWISFSGFGEVAFRELDDLQHQPMDEIVRKALQGTKRAHVAAVRFGTPASTVPASTLTETATVAAQGHLQSLFAMNGPIADKRNLSCRYGEIPLP